MKSRDLTKGKIYFSCGYTHNKYPIPVIETLVFVEKKKLNSGVEGFLFQTPEKFFSDAKSLNLSNNAKDKPNEGYSVMYSEENMDLVYDIGELQAFINDLKNQPHAEELF
jgi:hypothetical protein